MKRRVILTLLFLLVPAMLVGCAAKNTTPSRFAPSNDAPVLPSSEFTKYIEGARNRAELINKEAGTPIPKAHVAAVGPFELRPNPKGRSCKGKTEAPYDRGVLLVHGLNDTPFSMWDLAGRFAKECYLVRGILLPGHGTIPGDLLTIGLSDWREAVARGVDSFKGEADRVTIVGFDLGANLALDTALRLQGQRIDQPLSGKDAVELNGIVLLAPAFRYDPPPFPPAAVGPGGQALWGATFEKRDSLRYNSIAKPSVEAANRLGRDLFNADAPLHLPLFMVLSAEDDVSDAALARDWFCRQRVTPRELLWYSRYPDAPLPECRCRVERRQPGASQDEICVFARPSSCIVPSAREGGTRPLPSPEICRTNPYDGKNRGVDAAILDLAHIALLAAPENPRYGANAKSNDCLHYSFVKDTPKGKACASEAGEQDDQLLRYGETSEGNLQNYTLRRLTYNPDFDHMAEQMIDFLKRSN
jgi:esterase/lipase